MTTNDPEMRTAVLALIERYGWQNVLDQTRIQMINVAVEQNDRLLYNTAAGIDELLLEYIFETAKKL